MTTPRPDLTRYLVPAGELEYPEYAYNIRAADGTGRGHVRQLISSLLNTSGGVIKIDPGLLLDSKQFDQWRDRLKDQLLKVMPQHIYHQCLTICEEKGELFMLVKKSPIFITTESYMHIRGAGSSTLYVGHWQDIASLVSQEVVGEIPTIFPHNACYTYNDRCTMIENKSVEFKSYMCSTVDDLIRRLEDHRTLKSLLAMGNVRGGGEIILGIKEDHSGQGNIIVGQELDVSEEADFKQKLATLLREDAHGIKRIWGDPTIVPSEGIHWACDILQLGSPPYNCQPSCNKCPHRKRRCLIFIKIAQMHGGVYEKPPESFLVTDDGEVHMYTFSKWREKHKCETASESHLQQLQIDKPITSTTQTAITQAASSASKGAIEQISGIFEDDMQMSFRHHSSYAELHHFNPEYSDHHMRKSRIFEMAQPLHCTPPADDIERLTETPMDLVNLELEHEKGFGIADKCMYNCIEHNVEPSEPHGHVLDLFTLTANARAVLFIICAKFCVHDRDIIAYGMILGRVLKRKICQNLQKSDKIQSVDFCCMFLDLSSKNCHKPSPSFYNKLLKHTCELGGIISALGRVMTKVHSRFRDAVHLAAAISLSGEQTSTLVAITRTRFNVLEGPPGCGKTLLAQHVCETKGKDISAYISASIALNKRVQASGKVEAFLAKYGGDIVSLLCSELKSKVHIVIDDNHCYQHSDETLAEICRQITTTNKYLYVFQDSKFQNYQHLESSHFFRHLSSNNYTNWTFTTMSEIQRNSQIVGAFLKAQVKELHQDEIIRCVSDVEGNDIQITHVTNLRAPGKENGLLVHIRSLLSQPFSPGQWQCSHRDIAVLVDDSEGPEEVAMFRKIFEQFESGCNVHGAEVYPVEGTIVDLLKNFNGLESKVIVFIMPQCSPTSEQDDQARLRKQMIAVASRGIHRVDILQENNLNKELADRMKIDLYPAGTWKHGAQSSRADESHNVVPAASHGSQVNQNKDITVSNTTGANAPPRVWMCEKRKDVLDVCWLREGEEATVLYTTTKSVRRVSMTGDPISLGLDTSNIGDPWSVTCSRDGEWVVVVNCVYPGSWTAYSRHSAGEYREHGTHTEDGRPRSVRVTPQGHLAVLVEKGFREYHLRVYIHVSDPTVVWEKSVSVAPLVPTSGALSVTWTGNILVLELWGGVTEYSITDGSRVNTVPHPAGLVSPTSVCAGPSGRVWIGCDVGPVWLCGSTGGHKLIDEGTGPVWSLALRGHRLAVATWTGGLHLYDVEDAMRHLGSKW